MNEADDGKRWSTRANDFIGTPRVDAFLREISDVCRRHGFCIGHEDTGGAFVISKLDRPDDLKWLEGAHVDTTITRGEE